MDQNFTGLDETCLFPMHEFTLWKCFHLQLKNKTKHSIHPTYHFIVPKKFQMRSHVFLYCSLLTSSTSLGFPLGAIERLARRMLLSFSSRSPFRTCPQEVDNILPAKCYHCSYLVVLFLLSQSNEITLDYHREMTFPKRQVYVLQRRWWKKEMFASTLIHIKLDQWIMSKGKKAEVLALRAESRLTGNWLCDGNRY